MHLVQMRLASTKKIRMKQRLRSCNVQEIPSKKLCLTWDSIIVAKYLVQYAHISGESIQEFIEPWLQKQFLATELYLDRVR